MIVWTAVLLRNIDVGNDAVAARAPDRVADAKLLDPSRYWDRTAAGLYLVTGDKRRAAAAAEAILREEPRNITAWGVLLGATATTDPQRAAEAAAALRRLDPLGSRR